MSVFTMVESIYAVYKLKSPHNQFLGISLETVKTAYISLTDHHIEDDTKLPLIQFLSRQPGVIILRRGQLDWMYIESGCMSENLHFMNQLYFDKFENTIMIF